MKSEEFIREVDEELRRDQFTRLWRRYSAFVLAAAVAIVLATAGKVFWDYRQQQANEAEALRYVAAQQAAAGTDPADAATRLAALAADGHTGFSDLARLQEAKLKIAQKDEAGALAALQGLADDANADPMLRSLGALLVVQRQVASGDPAALKTALAPLAAAEAPWRNQARELQALLAIRTGALDEARAILAELSKEAGVAPSQQKRAGELLQAIGGAAPQASS